MKDGSRVSTHSHRVDKMSGLKKETKDLWTSIGKKVIKKLANAKRRRLLKTNKF